MLHLHLMNLTLQMTWAGPQSIPQTLSPVVPWLYHQGYELYFLEPELVLPDTIHRQIQLPNQTDKNAAKKTARPDVLLYHPETQTWIPWECKETPFSIKSSTAFQVLVMLALPGSELARRIGQRTMATTTAHVVLFVGRQGLTQAQTLRALRQRLQNQGLSANPATAIEVRESQGQLLLVEHGPNLRSSCSSNGCIVLSDTKMWNPYFPLPWDGDERMAEGKRFLQEQVRQRVVALIGEHLDDALEAKGWDLYPEQILQQIIPVWGYWSNPQARQHLLRTVREFIRRLLKPLERLGLRVERPPSGSIRLFVPDRGLLVPLRNALTVQEARQLPLPWEEGKQLEMF